MRVASHKFILPMMPSKMFIVSNIYKTMITTPTIRVDDTMNINFSSYNIL